MSQKIEDSIFNLFKKIENLQTLSTDSALNEADSAIKIMEKLLAKHNLDLAKIVKERSIKGEDFYFVEGETIDLTSHYGNWKRELGNVLAYFLDLQFFYKIYFKTGNFAGNESKITYAVSLFNHLVSIIENSSLFSFNEELKHNRTKFKVKAISQEDAALVFCVIHREHYIVAKQNNRVGDFKKMVLNFIPSSYKESDKDKEIDWYVKDPSMFYIMTDRKTFIRSFCYGMVRSISEKVNKIKNSEVVEDTLAVISLEKSALTEWVSDNISFHVDNSRSYDIVSLDKSSLEMGIDIMNKIPLEIQKTLNND